MEADQFASQLASFSMVEQQTLTNQNLDRMIRALSNGGLAAYSGLVGRVAAHEGAFVYSGAPVEMEIGIPGGIVEYAKLAILDGRGVMVAELNVDVGQEKLTWEGRGLDGRVLSPGSFTAEMRQVEDGSPLEIPVFTAAVVEEVRFGDGEAELLLADGTVLPESRVSKIR
jgi:flagellar basal-body rod modification protein FlgD